MASGPGQDLERVSESSVDRAAEASPLEQAVLAYLDACAREFDELEQLWFAEGDALEHAEQIDDWAA